jgi:MFS family permease
VYWIEYALSKMDSLSLAWRFPLGFQAVFLLIILCLAPFYPESPRHLALSIWLSDRIGRRKMMLTGCLAMGLVLIAGGVLSHEVTSGDPSKKHAYGIGVATILYLYTFIYGSTWLTTW